MQWTNPSIVRVVVGAVLVLIAMFLAGPVAVRFGGAVWSALSGWLLSDDADRRATSLI